MNPTQTTYVKKRIEEIFADKKQQIKSKYVWVPPILTIDQKLMLIAAGKFTRKNTTKNTYSENSLDYVLVFDGVENPNLSAEAAAYEALKVERTRLLDNLVLGDVKEALSLLENFAKKEF